jgi:hypothetical protein
MNGFITFVKTPILMKKMQDYLIKQTTQGKNNSLVIDTFYVVPIMCVDDDVVDGRPRQLLVHHQYNQVPYFTVK